YIRETKSLPPAPQVLPQLLKLLKQDDTDNAKVVKLVTFDPALTAKILQVCNSAAYSGGEPVADLNEALVRIGFGEVFKIVATVVGEQALGGSQRGYGIGKGELWEHSAVTAVAAQVIARKCGLDDNQAFTAGLLHDVGKIVLADALESEYGRLIEETEFHHHSLLEAEKTVLGADHAEVGGRLLEKWKFPEALVAAVRWHHDPSKAGEHTQLASVVSIANLTAGFTGHSFGHQAFAVHGRSEALAALGLEASALEHFMIQTLEALQKNRILSAA
ncbi:MAG TPA: hypothetical protein DCM86_08065, partial [Verrucomicrobiales bacterium]|nr:hypothetical protein [Verrucomicrobiales bacterium]